jgi:hypothetical protein
MVAQETYASKATGSGNDDLVAVNIAESTQPDWDEREERQVKRKSVAIE